MHFITRQYNMFCKYFVISFISIFLIFASISTCQANWSRKRFELAQANSTKTTKSPTWNQAGRLAYESAANRMAELSPEGNLLKKEISKKAFKLLRDQLGDFVDDIIIHWEKDLLYKWKHPQYPKYNIALEGMDIQAQAYGNHIYAKPLSSEFDALDFIVHLIHQLTHVRQFHDSKSSFSKFGYKYFKGYKEADRVYENNPMEEEAEEEVREGIAKFISADNSLNKVVNAWGKAGEAAYKSAAEQMVESSSNEKRLSHKIKGLLRPHFDKLVNDIIIHMNVSELPDRWEHSGYSITLEDLDTQAQAYGNHIYILKSRKLETLDFIALLIHHMTHVQQFKREESLSDFGKKYFKEYKKAGRIYNNNIMEKEARSNVEQFLTSVVSIRNNLKDKTIRYQLRWFKKGSWGFWKTHFLNPNAKQPHSVKGAAQPQIRFNDKFDRGYQESKKELKAMYFLKSDKPKFEDGKQYVFKRKGRKEITLK